MVFPGKFFAPAPCLPGTVISTFKLSWVLLPVSRNVWDFSREQPGTWTLPGLFQNFHLEIAFICQLTLFKCHSCFPPSLGSIFSPTTFLHTEQSFRAGLDRWVKNCGGRGEAHTHRLGMPYCFSSDLYHVACASWRVWAVVPLRMFSWRIMFDRALASIYHPENSKWAHTEFKILGCRWSQNHFTCLLPGENTHFMNVI